ncbi:O-antigen ligase family protein [Pseudonocardia nigra]|uniref:O-antigen ligase family protein n=1 Tax=Pseudonocardia nigra TaxID=1921578 RepID=UPI001C5DDBC6|nr:O-antigen ligase family protein [Pseudonocardia nigra]
MLAALLVTAVLMQDAMPLRLVLPVGAILLVLAIRPRSSTAVGIALIAIPMVGLLRRVTAGPEAFVPDDPLAVLPIVAAMPALAVAFTTGRTVRRTPGLNLFLAYVLWLLLTSLLSVGGSLTTQLTGLALAIVPAGVGYLVAAGRIPAVERLTTHTLIALPLLVGSYAVVQFFQPPAWDLAWLRSVGNNFISVGVPEPQGFRVWGTMESPLTAATYLGLGLLALLVVAVARRNAPGRVLRTIGCALGAVLLLAALLLTSVRTVLFALPLLLAVMVLLDLIPGARRYGVLFLVVVVGGTTVGVGTLGLGPEGSDPDRYAISSISEDTSFQERVDLLPAFLAAATNPIGTGAGSSGVAKRLTEDGAARGIDNGYLTLVVEGGLIRLVLFLGLIGIAIVRAARTARRNPRDPTALLGITALLYFGLLQTSADVISNSLSIVFWIFLGVAIRGTSGQDTASLVPAGRRARYVDTEAPTTQIPVVRVPAARTRYRLLPARSSLRPIVGR